MRIVDPDWPTICSDVPTRRQIGGGHFPGRLKAQRHIALVYSAVSAGHASCCNASLSDEIFQQDRLHSAANVPPQAERLQSKQPCPAGPVKPLNVQLPRSGPSNSRPLSFTANKTRMWANAQPDGRPAEHRWHPLFNAGNFG